jgi:hypothetical protein
VMISDGFLKVKSEEISEVVQDVVNA